jgi:hypothetical protein
MYCFCKGNIRVNVRTYKGYEFHNDLSNGGREILWFGLVWFIQLSVHIIPGFRSTGSVHTNKLKLKLNSVA